MSARVHFPCLRKLAFAPRKDASYLWLERFFAAFLPELPVLLFFELLDLEFGVRFNPGVEDERFVPGVLDGLLVLVDLFGAACFFAAAFFAPFFAPPLPRPTKSAIFEMMPGLFVPFLPASFAPALGTG